MKRTTKTKVAAFIFMAIMAILWVIPIIWAFFTSFKSNQEIIKVGFSFLPINWTLSNYKELLFNNTSDPIIKWFINSLFISISNTVLILIITSLAGYGYTRLKFKGRDLLFTFLLGTMMFPAIVNLIPLYEEMNMIGWVNTYWAVIFPGAANVFNVFLVRQFALGIPKALDESAKIDGANEFQIFYRIILPLLRPVMTVVALFSFTASWNDFLWPSVVITDINKMPITPALQLLQGQYQTYPGIGTAGALIALIPTVILYFFAQKYFMESMTLTAGVKE